MHMVCLHVPSLLTMHMEIMPLDRAKINFANVVPVLGDSPGVLGAMDASNEQFFFKSIL